MQNVDTGYKLHVQEIFTGLLALRCFTSWDSQFLSFVGKQEGAVACM